MKILITGGASGVGGAITENLAKDDQNKILFTYASSAETSNQLMMRFPNTRAIKCDFRNNEDVNSLQQIISENNIFILINNAFIGFEKKHFHKLDPEYFLENFKINIIPMIRITQSAILNFRKQKSGKIITILSSYIIGKPPVGLSEYTAQKAYLHSLCKSWAIENASFNITSNCISPSFMKTKLSTETDERIIEEMEKSHPIKKLLTPTEVAEAVNYFVHCSPHVNAANLIINASEDVI